MAVFFSSYTMRIDGKGRVSMPAAFRDALNKSDAVLMPKEGTPVIEGCDRAFVDELVARAYSPTASEDARERIQLLLGEMMTLSVDPEGRFVLPAPFRAHAALQDSAVFVGRGRTFEIWSPARYAEAREQRKARVGGESLSLNSAFFLEPPKS